MKKDKWIWMPHAGHFICGNDCRFHLCTYVGKYIVSTVGELWPDRAVQEIHAQIRDAKWYQENKNLKGDEFGTQYFSRFGWQEIGYGRTYETMVFKAKKSDNGCCPYEIADCTELDASGYNDPTDAYKGHIYLCKKWSEK